MSKRLGLMLSYVFILILVTYLAADALSFHNQLSTFITSYLDNDQTYFFVFTILLVPIFLFHHIPYLKPEYFLRMRQRIRYYIFRKVMLDSLQVAGVIFISFIWGGLTMGLHPEFSLSYFRYFLQVFLFMATSFLLYHAIYALVHKHFIAILILLSGHIAFLIAVVSISFTFIFEEQQFQQNIRLFSIIYLSCLFMISLAILVLTTKNKESYI